MITLGSSGGNRRLLRVLPGGVGAGLGPRIGRVFVRGRRLVVQEQRAGSAEHLGGSGQHEDAWQGRLQGHAALDRGEGRGADLLADGHAAVQQSHLERRAHGLALKLGMLVQSRDKAEGDREGARLRHDRQRHAEDSERARMPHQEGGEDANNGADVDAGRIYRARPQRRLQQHPDDGQGGEELQSGLELAAPAEGGNAPAVGNVGLGTLLGMLVAGVHRVGEPLASIDVPSRVPDPHEALHRRQVVQKPWA
mmetsp:Transcript_88398/g.172861  ORF Transcript_88398/g.172861 Transcript_88398/m.172861 type:complete len:252 (-) Transcript_88398:819-1574(-)